MIGEVFDPRQEYFVSERIRPHWTQAGAIVFITFRTKDSIPTEVMQRWDREKSDWLQRRDLFHGEHWSDVVPTLPTDLVREFQQTFNRRREETLDNNLGACVLRQPGCSDIVAKSLLHFDGDRYQMGDFVIMPNHVHLLAAFPTPEAMSNQMTSWLHFTATQINQTTGRKGKFWQREPFDHLVRSLEQYEYLRKYIAENPQKAKLTVGEYHHRKGP